MIRLRKTTECSEKLILTCKRAAFFSIQFFCCSYGQEFNPFTSEFFKRNYKLFSLFKSFWICIESLYALDLDTLNRACMRSWKLYHLLYLVFIFQIFEFVMIKLLLLCLSFSASPFSYILFVVVVGNHKQARKTLAILLHRPNKRG